MRVTNMCPYLQLLIVRSVSCIKLVQLCNTHRRFVVEGLQASMAAVLKACTACLGTKLKASSAIGATAG